MSAQTPMMKQYFEQKEQYKDTLLFFRMGDFFELFYDDAITASKTLDIALTKRGKAADGSEIPMCGVPAHSYESYLHKLINAGFKVAICDQLESPEEAKKRGYKEIVRREVVRVVTPGTLTEESLLESTAPNYLAAISHVASDFGLAWADISTGQFYTQNLSANQMKAELARINPSELVVPENLFYHEELSKNFADYKQKLTPQPNNIFEFSRAEKAVKGFYKVISLEGFGVLTRPQISASGALLEYLQLTQNAGNSLTFPKNYATSHYVAIDADARQSLDLQQLFKAINKTCTSAGARLLHSAISAPLAFAAGVNSRLNATEFFVGNAQTLAQTREVLATLPDLERSFTRIAYGRGEVRDMLAIKAALAGALELKNILQNQPLPPFLAEQVSGLNVPTNLLSQLVEAFKDNAAVSVRDGNFIRAGFDANLDTLVNIRDHSRRLIDDLKNQYAASTGIANLKIIYNNMLGYFIEVTAQNAKKLPENFIHRQTMANAMRFSTPELNEIQTKILTAAADALKIEQQIFADIAAQIVASADSILQTASSIAWLDFAASLASLALGSKYVRPVVDDSNAFEITGGRHPVVELTCNFTANSCNLTGQKIWLLTGPNMAGKSTFLRQNVLIALLAQIGSFVPATAAHIGCVDKIFSRVGASDNLARGQSTFMVEMLETAQILNEATQKSLVILDEIGRGTSTYDGLSIAWAVLEHLHNSVKCRAIFATHYHELTQLVLPRINLHAMKVREWKGDIVFLHEVGAGAAEKSYGIHVAKLAGLPPEVVRRAGEVLKGLEQKSKAAHELPLFAHAPVMPATAFAGVNSVGIQNEQENLDPSLRWDDNPIVNLLKTIDPNTLSPKDALDLVFRLKEF